MTQEQVIEAIQVVEALAVYLPQPAGTLVVAALKLAEDAVRSGHSDPEAVLDGLRASIRADWAGTLQARWPNG